MVNAVIAAADLIVESVFVFMHTHHLTVDLGLEVCQFVSDDGKFATNYSHLRSHFFLLDEQSVCVCVCLCNPEHCQIFLE